MIAWLRQHRTYNILILLAYFFLVVLPHQWVGILTVRIFGGLSRQHYNLLIATITLVSIIAGISILLKKLKVHPNRDILTRFLLLEIILMVLCFYFLFVINIEVVHLPQYALFAILCFPLFNNTPSTLTFTTFAGALDELYQYVILAPERSNYYDFNDVVIDLIGGAIGLFILRVLGTQVQKFPKQAWYKTFDFIFVAVITVVICILLSTGTIAVFHDNNPQSIFCFIKIPESGFWTMPPGPPARFHVMRPWEGLLFIGILWMIHLPLNFAQSKK